VETMIFQNAHSYTLDSDLTPRATSLHSPKRPARATRRMGSSTALQTSNSHICPNTISYGKACFLQALTSS